MADKIAEETAMLRALLGVMPDLTDLALVPPEIKAAIDLYVAERQRPGGFTLSVLKNDLAGACARADYNNLQVLGAIVSYCYNEIPAPCWGSPEIVEAWLTPESEDESMGATTIRARQNVLRNTITAERNLLRIRTDEGQWLQVEDVKDDSEHGGRVVIVAARGVPE